MGLLDKLITGTYKNQPQRKLFPTTRGEVFSELFRHRKRMLVNVSLLCALFALPAVACLYFGMLYRGILPDLVEEGSVVLPIADNYDLSLVVLQFQVINFCGLLGFVANALLFAGLGGGVRVIQLLAWGEPVEFFHDFGQGIKQNGLQYLGYSLLFSLSVLFFTFVTGYYLTSENHAAIKAFCIAVAALQLVAVCGTLVFALPHSNLYRLSFFGTLKNGFLLFIISLPKNLAFLLLSAAPLLLFLIPLVAVQTIVALVVVFLYPAYALLVWVLRANSEFDRFLNVGENSCAARRGIEWENTVSSEEDDSNENID